MSMDFATLSLLSDPIARRLFEYVVKMRSIRFEELAKRVEPEVDRQMAKTMLQKLEQAQLIGEKGAALDDYTTYYVTADGLEASRKFGT